MGLLSSGWYSQCNLNSIPASVSSTSSSPSLAFFAFGTKQSTRTTCDHSSAPPPTCALGWHSLRTGGKGRERESGVGATTSSSPPEAGVVASTSLSPIGQEQDEERCKGCLWTGLITCVGLSGYFAHAAFDPPLPHETMQQVLRQRRPLYLAISAGWLVLGAYRWHLG
jgi:hypothetical protein